MRTLQLKSLLATVALCLAWQLTLPAASAQNERRPDVRRDRADRGVGEQVDLERYDMQCCYVGINFEVWVIDRLTGQAWQQFKGEMQKISEPEALPESNYAISLITTNQGNFYTVHRIDRQSGRVWEIRGTKWFEIKFPD